MSANHQILSELFTGYFGHQPQSVSQLPPSGSNRHYYRLSSNKATAIGCIGESVRENRAFVYLAEHFASKGLPTPGMYAVSDDFTAYLQEDLGSESLYDIIHSGASPDEAPLSALLDETMRSLADIHYLGAEGLDFSRCYPVASMDRRSVMWDLNYFKYCFLKLTGAEIDEPALEDDFERLTDRILSDIPSGEGFTTFMYRDFQSRNVMVCAGTPRFIDFQGGRIGPAMYDIASFLWQARAGFKPDLRRRLVDIYIDRARRYADINEIDFKRRLQSHVLFRMLQVLGAYGFRGLHEKKTQFTESIPTAVANLEALLETDTFSQLPALASTVRFLSKKYLQNKPIPDTLVVTVTSFSFKKGIPDDPSGNGGGFVFDCRGMHNPGRYKEYAALTGRDTPVIEFLEERGEVQRFLESCFRLADMSVETYLRRGFTSLMVSFGCTGGRHRSVYCAEKMAAHLAEKYRLIVKLIHREQSISTTLSTCKQ